MVVKDELLKRAWEVMENAYAPYSKFHVGACVACRDGQFYCGANIENASYGLTSCAERNALFAAYSAGQRKEDIVALAIVSDGKRIATPCGACRQVIRELIPGGVPIYLSSKAETMETDIQALLPMSFSDEDLHHV